jgi:hypothetical protein
MSTQGEAVTVRDDHKGQTQFQTSLLSGICAQRSSPRSFGIAVPGFGMAVPRVEHVPPVEHQHSQTVALKTHADKLSDRRSC